jgi:hypothetical protein
MCLQCWIISPTKLQKFPTFPKHIRRFTPRAITGQNPAFGSKSTKNRQKSAHIEPISRKKSLLLSRKFQICVTLPCYEPI